MAAGVPEAANQDDLGQRRLHQPEARRHALKVDKGDMLRVTVNGKSVLGRPGFCRDMPEDSITVYFGYGRDGSGRVGNKIGYNAYCDPGRRHSLRGRRLDAEDRRALSHRERSGNADDGGPRSGSRRRSRGVPGASRFPDARREAACRQARPCIQTSTGITTATSGA